MIQFIHYNVGDFIYNDKKKPYAICCADKFDFKDQKERFILFNNVKNKRWSLISDINFNVNNINNENGLITTNEIINSNNLKNFPAFKYCKKFGDKAYIPTCEEFETLNKNLKQINKRLDITNYIDIISCFTIYSTLNKYKNILFNYEKIDKIIN